MCDVERRERRSLLGTTADRDIPPVVKRRILQVLRKIPDGDMLEAFHFVGEGIDSLMDKKKITRGLVKRRLAKGRKQFRLLWQD